MLFLARFAGWVTGLIIVVVVHRALVNLIKMFKIKSHCHRCGKFGVFKKGKIISFLEVNSGYIHPVWVCLPCSDVIDFQEAVQGV